MGEEDFVSYVAELVQCRPAEVIVKFKNPADSSEHSVHNSGNSIGGCGIRPGAVVTGAKKPSSIIIEEEKDIALSEEEILRQVLEISLRDLPRDAPQNPQQNSSRLDRLRPPSIAISHEEVKGEEDKERPKTPSTGESTPIWRHKRLAEYERPPVNNYQHLASVVEQYRNRQGGEEALRKEFEDKAQLAAKAVVGTRLDIKKRSNAEILQQMLKLEEDFCLDVAKNLSLIHICRCRRAI
eukprot:TRINITY_DN9619_c0_g1_i12.p1 TRINITY_DN9619_c0_g1~~TRINITY_DN9619_c0_g1_i12.p1  ORF type:complete len:239 (+),score=68.59 TRINITY_DN9619_c0_g1_i12:650-1366(+)